LQLEKAAVDQQKPVPKAAIAIVAGIIRNRFTDFSIYRGADCAGGRRAFLYG
jgi:hypothetical protein